MRINGSQISTGGLMKAKRHLLKISVKALVLTAALAFGSFWTLGVSSVQASQEHVNEMLKKAKYVGTETCATCHEKEYREFKLSTHARISNDKGTEGTAQGCEMCHGPGSLHAEAGGGKGVDIINPRKDPEICFTCHLDKKMEFNRKLFSRKMAS